MLGYIIAFVIGFLIAFSIGFFRNKKFTTIVLVSALLTGGSVALAYHLENSISSTIQEQRLVAAREASVIDKLMLIREAQAVYQEVNGNYTEDWNELISFIKNGDVPIIERKETIITLSYGADSIIVEIDTIGTISARERIFQETHNVLAANNGTFRGFAVQVGEEAEKGAGAYRLLQNGKIVSHPFKVSGEVTNTQNVSDGDMVTKGDLLMTVVEIKFNPNTDLDRLAYVPGYDDVKFDIYAAEIDKNGVTVDVIEVKNPSPFDPSRSEENEASNRKPLRFGSRTDVTTSGNWE